MTLPTSFISFEETLKIFSPFFKEMNGFKNALTTNSGTTLSGPIAVDLETETHVGTGTGGFNSRFPVALPQEHTYRSVQMQCT